jgi:hypothetical protein
MSHRGRGLRALGATMPGLTRRALGRRGFAEGGLALDWAAIAGPQIAEIALPLKLAYARGERRDGTLHVKVASGFAPMLAHCEPQLIERVNAYLGHAAVARIRLVQGPMPGPARKPPTADSEAPAEPLSGIEDRDLAAALGAFAAALKRRR